MRGELEPREINGGHVVRSRKGDYELVLQKSGEYNYRLAQIDNYMHLPRRKFPLKPPISMILEAKISSPSITGTWGFGMWNDPFSLGFGGGGMSKFLPVLPNAAWFFYGSNENALSLYDDQILGICHYHIFKDQCEILTLVSLNPRNGIGTALLTKVEEIATSCDCNFLSLTTTNDNLEALGFYQKHRFHLAALFPGKVDMSRQLKPEIPEIGYHGIPIRDELRLEKVLK